MRKIVIKFVAQKKHEESSEMLIAFDQSKLKYNLNPEWITIKEILQLKKTTLLKTDVFVFNDFSGPAFEHLCDSKALIIGTRCLLYCLSRNEALPSSKFPLYTLPFVGLYITASGLHVEQKEKVKTYIQWMGGVYDKELHAKTTHLISNNVTSMKYSKAAGTIPIMRYEWVEAVWNESKKDTVVGDCSSFFKESIQKFRLPPFHGLNITSASLSSSERERVKNCVDRNGGVYMGKYTVDSTDVLVVEQNGIESAKYKAAYQAKKEIVKPSWVFESEAKGYAMPMDDHRLNISKISTPKKNNQVNLTSNFSMISNIDSDKHGGPSMLDETVNVTTQQSNINVASYAISKEQISDVKSLFNLKSVRNAGLFLDGCGILLAGFTAEDREFLYRILNSGGATRYDEATERVSHVISSNNSNDIKLLFQNNNLTPFFVNINWLVESVKNKQVVPEDNFIIKFPDDVQPTAKKKLFTQSATERFSPRAERLKDMENQLQVMKMYKTNSTTNSTTLMDTTDFSKSSTRFHYLSERNIYFSKDFSDLQLEELSTFIADAGGCVINYIDGANYIIVPEKITKQIDGPDSCQIVTPLYIKCCLEQQNEVPVEYFHKPIITMEKKPLTDLVFSISSYSGFERYYIGELCRELGGICMDTFVRKSKPEKGLKGGTHLICKEAKGEKYKACISWGLPAVNVDWLLECYNTRARAMETPYLIGETEAPVRPSILEETTNHSIVQEVEPEIHMKNDTIITEEKDTNSKSLINFRKISVNQVTPKLNLKRSFVEEPEVIKNNCIEIPDDFEVQRKLINKRLENLQTDKSSFGNQKTPLSISKIMNRLDNKQCETPDTPILPLPDYMKTPDTPYGAFIHDNPSPETRKRWKRWCESLPPPASPITPKTPPLTWSGVKRELVKALMNPACETTSKGTILNFEEDIQSSSSTENINVQSPVQKQHNAAMNTQLEKLNELLTNGLGRIAPAKNLTPVSRKQSIHNIDTMHYDTKPVESQVESVGWRDPSELSPTCQRISDNVELKKKQPFRKRPPIFLLSGVADKLEITQIILDLGGEVCGNNSNEYDPICSHILCDQPSRSEKLLAGMSSGKWILSTDYIINCLQEKCFIEEEPFEWGNPTGEYCSGDLIQEAGAYYKWRCKLNNSPDEFITQGAFSGWKVLLHLGKKASFGRVIKAGLGEIVECDNMESLREGSVTHCFCEPRKNPLNTDQIRHLIRIGAHVLPVQYLNKYLLEDPTPDPKLFLITV